MDSTKLCQVPVQAVYNGCWFLLLLLVVVILSCQTFCFSWKLIDSVCLLPLLNDYWVRPNFRKFSEDLRGTLAGKQRFIDSVKMFHVNVKPQRKEKYFLLLFSPSEAIV